MSRESVARVMEDIVQVLKRSRPVRKLWSDFMWNIRMFFGRAVKIEQIRPGMSDGETRKVAAAIVRVIADSCPGALTNIEECLQRSRCAPAYIHTSSTKVEPLERKDWSKVS